MKVLSWRGKNDAKYYFTTLGVGKPLFKNDLLIVNKDQYFIRCFHHFHWSVFYGFAMAKFTKLNI